MPRDAIVQGLRSFAQDSAANPGRLNLFERDGVLAIVDFAHNEAGLAGLMDVCRTAPRGRRSAATFGWRSELPVTGPMRSCTASESSPARPMSSSSARSVTTCAAATSRR